MITTQQLRHVIRHHTPCNGLQTGNASPHTNKLADLTDTFNSSSYFKDPPNNKDIECAYRLSFHQYRSDVINASGVHPVNNYCANANIFDISKSIETMTMRLQQHIIYRILGIFSHFGVN